MFRQLLGQERVIKFLTNAISNNRIAHAYLFYGQEGVGKFQTALYFSMAINCHAIREKRPCGFCDSCHKFLEFSHPDLQYIFPTPPVKSNAEGDLKDYSSVEYQAYIENRKNTPWQKFYFSGSTLIRKERIDYLHKNMEYSQTEGRYRVCIVENAEEMNEATTNSFLKTLEEPLANTTIILITTQIQSLMPTVLSRCQLVYFHPIPYKFIEQILITKHDVDKSVAKAISVIANGNVEQAIRLAKDEKQIARSVISLLLKALVDKDDLYIVDDFLLNKDVMKTEVITDLLKYMANIFKEVAIIKSGYTEVHNIDFNDIIQLCCDNFHDWEDNVVIALNYIDEMHKKVNSNVNVQFVLINLYNYLKKLLH